MGSLAGEKLGRWDGFPLYEATMEVVANVAGATAVSSE